MAECDFESDERDFGTLACSRIIALLKQGNSALLPFIQAFVNQTQDANVILVGVLAGRCLDDAVGVQLDVIGELIGIQRPTIEGDELSYFTTDTNQLGWDGEGIWFTTNAPLTGFFPAPDDIYRQHIRGKILKNHVNSGSIPDIIAFISVIFGIVSSVIKIDATTIDIQVPSGTPNSVLTLLASVESNSLWENEYFLPIGMGVRLNSVVTA